MKTSIQTVDVLIKACLTYEDAFANISKQKNHEAKTWSIKAEIHYKDDGKNTIYLLSEVVPIEILIEKAGKYDELETEIASFYFNDVGNLIEDDENGDLLDIGEAVASHFGYL